MLALYFPASDIALCRACYRWSIALQELSIQLYCYRYASSISLLVILHSVERAIVSLSPCWVLFIQKYCYRPSIVLQVLSFRSIAIDMLALYIPAGDIALCRACYR